MTTKADPTSIPVAQATKMAADSIGAIDQQVLAVSQIPPVDATVLPRLKADLDQLNITLATWPASLRPLAVQSLREAGSIDTAALAPWAGIDRKDQQALLAFAESLRQAVAKADGSITKLVAGMAPFRAAVDQSVSGLETDLNTLNEQIATQQKLVETLVVQVQVYEQEMAVFSSPEAGLAMAMGDLTLPLDAIAAAKATELALAQAQQNYAQLQHLSGAVGPLLSLSSAVAALGVCSSNMQTAVSQVANLLNDILEQKPLPAILAAQLQTIVDDLNSADEIIDEIDIE